MLKKIALNKSQIILVTQKQLKTCALAITYTFFTLIQATQYIVKTVLPKHTKQCAGLKILAQ